MRARLGTVVLKSELNVLVWEINACHRTAVERMQHLFDSQRHCLSGKRPEPFKLFPLRSEAAPGAPLPGATQKLTRRVFGTNSSTFE
jgi:hypothetical protein